MLSLFRNSDRCTPRHVTLRSLRSAVLLLILVVCPVSVFAAEVFSVKIPETLNYDLTWTGIKAGEASLAIRQNGDDITITSTARSARWISVFYMVNDIAETRLQRNQKTPGSAGP